MSISVQVEGNVNRAEGLVAWLTACCCCTCCVRDKQYNRGTDFHGPKVTAPETVVRPCTVLTTLGSPGAARARAQLPSVPAEAPDSSKQSQLQGPEGTAHA